MKELRDIFTSALLLSLLAGGAFALGGQKGNDQKGQPPQKEKKEIVKVPKEDRNEQPRRDQEQRDKNKNENRGKPPV